MKRYPTLYKVTKKGQIAVYDIAVYVDTLKRVATMFTEKSIGLTGKVQTDEYRVRYSVNEGKANEVTYDKLIFERAESAIKRKQDDGYKTLAQHNITCRRGNYYYNGFHLVKDASEGGDPLTLEEVLDLYVLKDVYNTDARGFIKPMLAHKMTDKTELEYPVFAQPKLDGIRCLSERVGKVINLRTRTGKPIKLLPHILKELLAVQPDNTILDGELYLHKSVDFQGIISATRRTVNKSEKSKNIQYHVYDMVDTEKTFTDRHNALQKMGSHKFVVLVDTYIVRSDRSLLTVTKKFVKEGYEGTMIRIPTSTYLPGFRSYDLLKLKEYDEDEFELESMFSASGRDKGTAVFNLKTANGKIFSARPKGSHELRTWYLKNKNKLIGKMVTVQYQGLSNKGIPRFPSAKCIRDYE